MSSEIRVNKINNRAGLGTVTYTDTGIVVSGVSTASNFKTGSSNLHSSGIEVSGVNVLGGDTPIGLGATIYNSGAAVFTGVTTASQGLRVPHGSDSSNYISVGNGGSLRFWATGHCFADIRAGGLHFRNASLDNVLEIQQDKDIWMYGATYTLGAARFDSTVTMADSLIHFGDTDTKIRFPANDTFSVETGGNERFRIASDGQNTIKSGAHDKGLDILPVGNQQETRLRIQAKNSSGTEHTFTLGAKQSGNRMDIYGTGPICFLGPQNVGVHNTAPTSPLHVGDDTNPSTTKAHLFVGPASGDGQFHLRGGNPTVFFDNASSGNTTKILIDGSALTISDGTLDNNGNERLRIGNSGGVGINTTLIRNNRFLNIAAPSQDFSNNSTELMDGGGICLQHTDTLASTNRTYPGIFWSGNTASLGRARAGILGITASNNDATDIVFLTRTAANGTGFYPSDERMRIMKDGRIGIKFKGNYTMNPQSTDLVIGDGGSGRGITLWTASAADNQTISFQTNETLSRAEGEIAYGPTGTSTVADRNAMMFRTNSAERFRIDKNGSLTNTTNSSHSQGAGTFNIKGVINQYSQGSGSGLIFDCDFGRLTGYGDDTNVGNGTNLSACLSHSTTDWASSNSNTPMTVNNGTFQYRVGFGGYFDSISNGGRVSVAAGSGSPNMASTLNTANMTIESWVWYGGGGREVICSRWGSGFPAQFNMICDPSGQFHYNSGGVGASGGNVSGEHFPDDTWHHHLWQYESGVHRWYINGAFANSRSAGSSLAVSSNTGFGILSRADDYERWRGKIAIVRIYNRALSAAEIKNHFELERGRFGV